MTEKMQLEDWLDDLCVRFIINLPEEDLSSVARICFQVEEAQWFYEDFIRPLDPALPSMPLKSFCLRIFQHCPLLSAFSLENHMKAFEEFLLYKTRVPVRGAIMLNEAMDSVVLVKGWKKGANWSFPRGKINKDEDDLDCAIREVYEETGFDIHAAGLVPADRNVKYIEMAIREQHMRLYVFRNVPMDTPFEPKTRKEISKIQWYRLSDLPAYRKKGQQQQGAEAANNANKFYMVAPFLVPLKKWVVQQLKKDSQRAASNPHLAAFASVDEHLTEEEAVESSAEQTGRGHNGAGIDTLEGATAALHRLLKIQPATQGLQTESATSQPSQNSGSALLALLNGQSAPSAPPPQTPFELTYEQAPIPRTPPHHHPRPLLSSHPEPPSFPLEVSHGRQAHPQMAPSMPPAQQHPQFQAILGQGPHLQHPQPLPPQVQSSLFATANGPNGPRGVHSHQTFGQQVANPQAARYSNPAGLSQPMAQFQENMQAQRFQQPQQLQQTQQTQQVQQISHTNHGQQLSTHSISLLNAFKGIQPNQGPGIPELETPRVHQQVQISQEAESFKATGPAPVPNPLRPPASSEHQKTLLGLFKQPSAVPEQKLRSELEVTTLSQAAIIHELPAATPFQHGHPQSTNGEQPFEISSKTPKQEASATRPVTILSRPQTAKRSTSPAQGQYQSPQSPVRQARPSSQQKASPRAKSGKNEVEKSAQKPFQPQILRRPQPSSPLAPQKSPSESGVTAQVTTNQALLDLFKQPSLERRSSQLSQQSSPPPAQQNPSTTASSQTLLDLFKQGPTDRQTSQLAQHNSPLLAPQRPQAPPSAPNASLLELLKQPSERRTSQTSLTESPSLGLQQSPPPTSTQSQTLLGLLKPPATASPVSHLTQQKRNLLSMFANGSTPITPPLENPPRSTSFEQRTNDTLANALARSRVGSLADAESEQNSRRGSQTPISPADEAFLLGYLEQAAKASGR